LAAGVDRGFLIWRFEAGKCNRIELIQRFGSALNLNIHFHLLFRDGIYLYRGHRPPRFQRVRSPDKGDLEELVRLISQRVGRCLVRQAYWSGTPRAPGWNSIRLKTPTPCPGSWDVPSPTA
jgi:hypothetical protein